MTVHLTDRIVAYLEEHGTGDVHQIAEGISMRVTNVRIGVTSALKSRRIRVVREHTLDGVNSQPAIYGLGERPPRGIVPNVRSVFEMAQAL